MDITKCNRCRKVVKKALADGHIRFHYMDIGFGPIDLCKACSPAYLKFLKKYDLLFYLTDGSVFYSSARKSILHIQSPIKVNNGNLWKRIKN